MTANRCVVPSAPAALFRLLHTGKIISPFRWAVLRKIAITDGIVVNAGKWSVPLPGSIIRVAWIAFWNAIRNPIVPSCESSSFATT